MSRIALVVISLLPYTLSFLQPAGLCRPIVASPSGRASSTVAAQRDRERGGRSWGGWGDEVMEDEFRGGRSQRPRGPDDYLEEDEDDLLDDMYTRDNFLFQATLIGGGALIAMNAIGGANDMAKLEFEKVVPSYWAEPDQIEDPSGEPPLEYGGDSYDFFTKVVYLKATRNDLRSLLARSRSDPDGAIGAARGLKTLKPASFGENCAQLAGMAPGTHKVDARRWCEASQDGLVLLANARRQNVNSLLSSCIESIDKFIEEILPSSDK